HPSISHDGTSATATLTYQPVANQYTSGTPVTITVTVEDNEEPPSSNFITFNVTVNPQNDDPTLDALSPLGINEDGGLQTVNLTGISPGPNEDGQNLVITAVSKIGRASCRETGGSW